MNGIRNNDKRAGRAIDIAGARRASPEGDIKHLLESEPADYRSAKG